MLAILIGGSALAILNQTAVSPMLPTIMQDMGVSSSTAQWLVSGYTMVLAIFVPVSAYLMKRVPTRTIFFSAMAMFLTGSILCALAPNFPALLFGRCLQGGCAGIMMPFATSVMLLVFPVERRGTAVGIYSLVTMLMPAIGPTATGFLVDLVNWRMVYAGMAALVVALILTAIPVLSNYGTTSEARLDLVSVVVSSCALTAFLYGTSEFGNQGAAPITIGAMAVGIALICYFVVRQRRVESPLLDLSVFSYSRFAIGLCLLMGLQLLVNANAVIMPLIVQQGMGKSASDSGLLTMPGALLGAVTALCAGKTFDRFGPRVIAFCGAMVVGLAYVGFSFVRESTPLLLLTVFDTMGIIGMMCISTPLNSWSLSYLPDELIPHGNATSNTLRQVAGAVGTAVFVSIMSVVSQTCVSASVQESFFVGARVVYCIIAACALVIAAGIFMFVREDRQ